MKSPRPAFRDLLEPLAARLRAGLPGMVSSRGLPHVIAVLSIGLLTLVSFLLWLEVRRRFPVVEPGSYFGSLSGVFTSINGESPLYLEHQAGRAGLVLVVPRPGWAPQDIPLGTEDHGLADAGWISPVTVSGPDGTLRFIGARSGPGEYSGGVVNIDTGFEGHWSVRRVESSPTSTDRDAEIRHWLALKGELSDVGEEISLIERRIPDQKAEIEKLTTFIEERERLKSSADDKFEEVKESLRESQVELRELQDEARKLEAELDLAQRFTGMGRLVSLSRESLEREGRWIDSMLRSDIVSSQRNVEVAVARATKIAALKRDIAAARAELVARRESHPPRVGTEAAR